MAGPEHEQQTRTSADEDARRLALESDLVARAQRGDHAAFDELVEMHLLRVWRVVWRIVRNEGDAEDVVQEVFLNAWRKLDSFRGEARLSTWLHRIAVNRALNHVDRASEKLRRASRSLEAPAFPHSEGEWVDPKIEAAVESPAPSPLRVLEGRELARRLKECLEKIPAGWRAVLALREGEGLAYDEIANTLDIALGTVRSRLARARVSLRDCVEGRA